MYDRGSAVDKALFFYPTSSPIAPLIFTGGQKVRNFGFNFRYYSPLSRPRFEREQSLKQNLLNRNDGLMSIQNVGTIWLTRP